MGEKEFIGAVNQIKNDFFLEYTVFGKIFRKILGLVEAVSVSTCEKSPRVGVLPPQAIKTYKFFRCTDTPLVALF